MAKWPHCGSITTTTTSTTPTTTEIEVTFTEKPTTPEITELPTTVPPTGETETTTSTIISQSSPQPCPPNEVWESCHMRCNQICHYYHYYLQKTGRCLEPGDCISGCVPKDLRGGCPPRTVWRDEKTCVQIADCTCHSHMGHVVSPGNPYTESDTEECQCLDNEYFCTNTTISTTERLVFTGSTGTTSIRNLITTETPPSKCEPPLRFVPLVQGDSPLPNEAITASSESPRPGHQAHTARIYPGGKSVTGGSWMPARQTPDEYLQIDLGDKVPVYGVSVQGDPDVPAYVTSYRVLHSDGHLYRYVMNAENSPMQFRGPMDEKKPAPQMFHKPVEARFIRINPMTWENAIAMRVEVIGCGEVLTTTTMTTEPTAVEETSKIVFTTPPVPIPECEDEMGLDKGVMSEEQVLVSSVRNGNKDRYGVSQVALSTEYDEEDGSAGAWIPASNDAGQWIQFDFLEPRNLTGIVTKGQDKGDSWTKTYKVLYSHDGEVWNPIITSDGKAKKFPGNFDSESPQKNIFERMVQARYLRIIPTTWEKNIAMRVEVIGCYSPYPEITSEEPLPTTIITTTEIPKKCNLCPGLPTELVEENCYCDEPLLWDGKECINSTYCPCFVKHIRYQVGAVFHTEKCDVCVCKLNGVPECKKKECPPCAEGLQSTLSPTCGCLCKPCPENTVLCPTTSICINETLWCNGVEDCPDDELNCNTSPVTTEPTVSTTPVITTPTPTPTPCPPVECEPGFRPVFAKPAAVKTTRGGTYTKGGRKGDRRPQPRIVKYNTSSTECPAFTCEPMNGNTTCGKPRCPPSYRLVSVSVKNVRCPRYECVPPEATCNVTGRTFNTFDGTEFKYDICNHVLAEDYDEKKWDISLVSKCRGGGPCTKHLDVIQDEHSFILNPDLSLEFDGMTYTPDETKRIGGRNKAFFLTRMGDSLFFKSNRYGFWIVWDKQSNVKIGVPRKLKGRVDGLCGFYNGKPEDDKLMSSGLLAKTTKEFGDSWSNGESPDCEVQHCPIELQNKALEMCALVRSEPLSKCQVAVNVDQFQSHCVETICECLAAKTPAEDCRCQALLNYVTKCQEADTSIDLTGWRIQHDCPADCKPPLVHYDCYRHECEPTCEGLRDSEQQCLVKTGNCFAGCFCPDGQLRKGDKCVKPAECRDCVCDGFGDPQYMTFDRSNYTFNGNCTYIAVQDVKPEGNHEYQVIVNNKQCPDEPASTCTHGITVKYKGNTVHINNTGSKLDVYVNGRLVADRSISEPWLRLDRVPGTKVTVLIVPIQLEVSYFFHNYQFTVRLSSHLLGSQTEGLCGNCNGNKTDDILLSNGTFPKNIDDFGLSWLVPENSTEQICRPPEKEKGCIPLPPDEDPCLQLLDAAVFQKCRNILDPSPYIAACQFDLCHSLERKTAACRDMEAYVRDCERAGICLDWRSDVMCPYKCREELEYRACQPGCINTCDNLMDDSSSCDSTIIDGCFCPEDKVLRGNECVNRNECEPCDAENHYDGDVWQPDYCTNCTCIGKSKECQRTDCSTSTTICDIGMTAIEVSGSEKECCKKVICVPEAITTPGPCAEPKIPVCQPDQEQTSVTGADGCIQIVCKCKPCKPLTETGTPDLEAGPLPLPEPGMVEVLNTSGCCPHYVWVCDREECPRPNECRPPLIPLEDPKAESKCCPTYHCGVPPNECVIELKNSSEVITKKIGHTWQETPCTSCICLVNAGGRPEVRCNDTVCPSSDMSENLTIDYEVETVTPPGECCPHIRKNACKVGERILKPGESWVSQQPSHCEMFMCMETGDRSVKKDVVLEKCVTACELGSKYHLPEPGSGECCGQCKPVGCVINGNVYTEGHIQISKDNCTQYYCLSNNGTFQVDTVTTKCPDIPSEILDDYQVVLKEVPGECCKKPQYVACKHEGVIYQPGETWESLTDPCKNITCAESPSGELSKTEVLQICPDSCSQGWQYVPPLPGSPLCCGQCKQVACVQDGQLYDAGSTWKSLDGCTEYSCANTTSGQFQVTSMSEPCPVLGDCKPENIYEDGCCRRCRIPEDNLINCKPQPSVLHQKVIKQHDATHGLCENLEPVQNFSVCEGHCTSSTRYNSITNKHENDCKCCTPTKYASINVTMTCADKHVYNHHIPVPTICSCHACGKELTSGVIASKTVS